ncbi:MAG: nucleoside kinase [Dysgonamonadaceae bacterium]|jgi:uridine kinase|nr:nucleoside kinase [Dysgonamonadaceae bacterium]
MEETIYVYCKNNNRRQAFKPGISLLNIYKEMEVRLPYPLACAKVNNVNQSLSYLCYKPKDVEFIGINEPSGMRAYVRSLCFVLSKATHDLFPGGKLYIEHALSKGYYCEFEIGRELTAEDVVRLKQQMQEIIAAGRPFITCEDRTPKVIELLRENGMNDKAILLETIQEAYSKYNVLDDYIDYYHGALLPDTRWIHLFDIEKYNGGLLLRIPNRSNPTELDPYINQEKMLAVFRELRQFQKAIDMNNVGELNQRILAGDISTVVQVAETLQERQIGRIADEISRRCAQGVQFVLISGPSSSGKTTFCKRLQIQLIANTLRPIGISLDDYYVNRKDTPRDENGEYDYESFYALDLKQLDEDLCKILAGEKVALPSYNFQKGERTYKGNIAQLGPKSVLVIEGIHAMNPALAPNIPPEATYKIYVSALTSISLDDHNWISTTDNRLIRRIVRDYQFRGYSAKNTIARWPSVRRGEDKWIFPYQENADAMFNSAMLYELAALRKIAEPVLKEVTQMDIEYSETHRLLQFLRYFAYIDAEELPNTSLLREFVGGSSFKY